MALIVKRMRSGESSGTNGKERAFAIALGLLLVAVLGFRFASISQLNVLPGIDSYQHTTITKLFVEDGGIPSDYAPWSNLETFSYHFGIHAGAAQVSP